MTFYPLPLMTPTFYHPIIYFIHDLFMIDHLFVKVCTSLSYEIMCFNKHWPKARLNTPPFVNMFSVFLCQQAFGSMLKKNNFHLIFHHFCIKKLAKLCKKCEKAYFNQHLKCAAPEGYSNIQSLVFSSRCYN